MPKHQNFGDIWVSPHPRASPSVRLIIQARWWCWTGAGSQRTPSVQPHLRAVWHALSDAHAEPNAHQVCRARVGPRPLRCGPYCHVITGATSSLVPTVDAHSIPLFRLAFSHIRTCVPEILTKIQAFMAEKSSELGELAEVRWPASYLILNELEVFYFLILSTPESLIL